MFNILLKESVSMGRINFRVKSSSFIEERAICVLVVSCEINMAAMLRWSISLACS